VGICLLKTSKQKATLEGTALFQIMSLCKSLPISSFWLRVL